MRALVLTLLAPLAADAAAPLVLSHQGRLIGSDGAPLDGSFDVRVTLYDNASQADPGLWTRQFASLPVQDGYYAVSLVTSDASQPLNAAHFDDGEVWVGVKVGGVEIGPRQPLGSVPFAIAAGSASSGGASVSIVTNPTGACTNGTLVYDTGISQLRICQGGSWGTNIVQDGAFRRWADGSFATSCDGYRHPSGPGSYTGATGTGIYRINPGGLGAFDAWCEMDKHGGGWTLALNLDTNDGNNRHYDDTTFWETASPINGVENHHTADFKSEAFDRLGVQDLMIQAHNEGSSIGTAYYDLLPSYVGQSLRSQFATRNNVQFTSARTEFTGAVGSSGRARNAGDPFIDHSEAVWVNMSNKFPSSAENLNRLGTDGSAYCSTISCNGHTFGGLGGRHYNGGWGTRYEGSAMNGYCQTQGGYGTNGVAYNGNNAFNDSSNCGGSSIQVDVDFAIFVR
jgi:hypothetical protein